jgi:hypothetical protein
MLITWGHARPLFLTSCCDAKGHIHGAPLLDRDGTRMGNEASIKTLSLGRELGHIASPKAVAHGTQLLDLELVAHVLYGRRCDGLDLGARMSLAPAYTIKACLVDGDGITFEVVGDHYQVSGRCKAIGESGERS